MGRLETSLLARGKSVLDLPDRHRCERPARQRAERPRSARELEGYSGQPGFARRKAAWCHPFQPAPGLLVKNDLSHRLSCSRQVLFASLSLARRSSSPCTLIVYYSSNLFNLESTWSSPTRLLFCFAVFVGEQPIRFLCCGFLEAALQGSPKSRIGVKSAVNQWHDQSPRKPASQRVHSLKSKASWTLNSQLLTVNRICDSSTSLLRAAHLFNLA